MKPRHSILYIGRDVEFKQTILARVNYEIWCIESVRSSSIALELIHKKKYDLVILDEAIFSNELLNEHPTSNLSDIYAKVIKTNSETGFIFVFEKSSTFIRSFKKKNNSTALFSRNDVTPNRLNMTLKIMRREKFQPIMIEDIKVGKKSEFNLFFNDQEITKQKIYIKKNDLIKKPILDLARRKGLRHLYIHKSDLKIYFDNDGKKSITSSQLYKTREKIRSLFLDLIDHSGPTTPAHGKKLFEDANNIAIELDEIIKGMPSPVDALEHLPYPRMTALNHSLNVALYTLCLANQIVLDEKYLLAIAALVHDIGLENVWNEENNFIEEEQISPLLTVEAEAHVESTILLLRSKNFLINKDVESYVKNHHENITGTGYPFGKKKDQKRLADLVIGFGNELDHSRAVKRGDFGRAFLSSLKTIVTENEVHKKIPDKLLDQCNDMCKSKMKSKS